MHVAHRHVYSRRHRTYAMCMCECVSAAARAPQSAVRAVRCARKINVRISRLRPHRESETPGAGNVIRIVNTSLVEFPMTAGVVPHSINQGMGSGAVLGGDVVIGGDVGW